MPKKILVVDDDEKVQLLLSEILTSGGFQIISAADGDEALQLIHSEKPDIILLDLVMPRMNGYEVCKQIRNDSDPKIAKTKIIVLSVKNYTVDIKTAKIIGADKYLIKPCSSSELLATINELLKTSP